MKRSLVYTSFLGNNRSESLIKMNTNCWTC